jgi:hypothetical protein
MKKGKHPEKALSAVRVRSIDKPGRYADGNGLYLIVEPSGAKRWVLRTIVQGNRRDIGLGGCKLVSLAEARETALAFRKIARSGGDPLAEPRNQRRIIPTFEQAACSVHAEHLPSWKNPKHGAQWINTLARYVFPILGHVPVDKIETADVLKVLSPIWLLKTETARRVRQRIGTVLDWAQLDFGQATIPLMASPKVCESRPMGINTIRLCLSRKFRSLLKPCGQAT